MGDETEEHGAQRLPKAHSQGTKWFQLSRISLALLLLISAGSIALSFMVRNIVADQERTILHERGGVLALVLNESVQEIGTVLPIAGAVASSGTRPHSSFELVTASLVQSGTNSVAVALKHGETFKVIAKAGKEVVGPTITGSEATLLLRASSTHGLVTGIIHSGNTRRLAIAISAPGGPVTIYESIIQTTHAPPPAAGSPFSDVNIALYASSRATPSNLVVVSGATPSGEVDRQFLTVGNDRWLLLTSARQPLVGSITAWAAWVSLLVGLLTALLVTALIEGLARRRTYALGLVQVRTAQLEGALSERSRLQEAERRAREEAEKANQDKNQFISRMSHELSLIHI